MNTIPDIISPEDIAEIVTYGVSPEYAFSVVLAAALGLDIVDNAPDKQLFNSYFAHMIHRLDADEYDNNPYFANFKLPTVKIGNSELKYEHYKPYEGFVCNDIVTTQAGRHIPQIGFFMKSKR